jgi:hypothetical protein
LILFVFPGVASPVEGHIVVEEEEEEKNKNQKNKNK